MKAITLTLLSFIAFVTVSVAQAKAVQKIVIKTPTVQCEMCKTRIENYFKREPGISVIDVNYKKKTTTVTFLTDRNNIEQIKTAIANAGYDADDITADETAYKKLPACCKRPAETAKPAEKKN